MGVQASWRQDLGSGLGTLNALVRNRLPLVQNTILPILLHNFVTVIPHDKY
jgi:hypothetical protein